MENKCGVSNDYLGQGILYDDEKKTNEERLPKLSSTKRDTVRKL